MTRPHRLMMDPDMVEKAAHMLRRRTPEEVSAYLGFPIARIEAVARNLPPTPEPVNDRDTPFNELPRTVAGCRMPLARTIENADRKRAEDARLGSEALLAAIANMMGRSRRSVNVQNNSGSEA